MPSKAVLLGKSLPVHTDVEYFRFRRLGILGFLTVLVPNLMQIYFHAGFSSIRFLLLLTISSYCAHISLVYGRSNAERDPFLAFLLIFLLASRTFVEFLHGELDSSSLFSLVATSIIVWAVWSLQPRVEWLRIFGVFGAAIGLISLLMAVVTPKFAFMVTEYGNLQGGYKGALSLGLLAGPFSNANTLGILMATSLPMVFFWRGFFTRAVLLIPIVTALALSFARTSIITVVILFFLVIFVFSDRRSLSFKSIVAGGIISILFLVQLLIPFFTHDRELFTGRGAAWIVDVAAWLRHPWFGNGDGWYNAQEFVEAGIMQIPHTNSHNTFLNWLVFGGIFYFFCSVCVFGMLVYFSFKQLSDRNTSVPILFVITLLIVGISESFWHLFSTSPLFFMSGLPVILIIFSRQSQIIKT